MSRGYCSGCLQPVVCEARGGCQGPHPHTDAGALLKLIDGIEKRAFDIPASNLVTPQIVQMCIAARNILTRQAASQGSAGGERSEVRSEVVAWQKRRNDYARGEWIQVLPEHVDEAKSRRWQVRPLYAAPQPAIVAQAPWKSISSAPKDGTSVLLAIKDADNEWCQVQGWYEAGLADRQWYDVYHGPIQPDYWKPLDAPPSPAYSVPSAEPCGHCWCGLHVTLKDQCDRCMKRGAFAVPSASSPAQARQERHEATYLRGWNEGIECAVEALEKEGWYTPQDTIRKLVEESPVPSAQFCTHGVKVGNTCVGCVGAAHPSTHLGAPHD